MINSSSPSESRAERYVSFLRQHALVILLVAGALAAGCGVCVAQLQLRTDFAELLPSHDASVRELRRMQASLHGTEALIINIYSHDRAANLRFSDDLVAQLRTLPRSLVGLAVNNIRAERQWFDDHKGLYLQVADLELLRDRLRDELHKQKSAFYVDLETPSETLEQIEQRLTQGRGAALGPSLTDRFPDGYFVTRDGQTAMVIVMPPGGVFHEHAGERLRDEVQKVVAGLDPTARGITEVGYSGDIESSLEERNALENDLVWATGLCTTLVCLIVMLYFGRWRALPLMALPAALGTLGAYAVASLSFGYLNSSTAFLASIIMGNGINFAIIQMARYEEERRQGSATADALTQAVLMTVRATAIAAMAASISYGSLIVTQFRGFSQFGIIGGVGMLVAWISTVTVLPALLWLLDRNKPPLLAAPPTRGFAVAGAFARVALHSPRRLAISGALFTLAALSVLPAYIGDPFEYNFRNLRSSVSDNTKTGEARWYAANGEVFGRALNPLVVLTHDAARTDATRDALMRADTAASGAPMLSHAVVLGDLVPGTVQEQEAKIPVLAEIRAVMRDPYFRLLPKTKRDKLMPLMPPADLAPVTAHDLPALARRPFTEVDGTLGRVVLVFPKTEGYDPWSGQDMMRLDERVATIAVPDAPNEYGVGAAVLFTGMIRSIVRDGPLATLTSAVGVALLVYVLLRRRLRGTALVLGTLAAGFIWMLGAAAALGLRINFLNFVALPVTLGIGVDYGINIYLRAQLEGPGRLGHALRATGGAVALCSATTIIGYGALLVADNRGLRSFGTLAILGEVACLAAALLLMPALLALRDGAES